MGGRQLDPDAGREPRGGNNFGPLEAHSGIQDGRCIEFDLTESYLWMHDKDLSDFNQTLEAGSDPRKQRLDTNIDVSFNSCSKLSDDDSDNFGMGKSNTELQNTGEDDAWPNTNRQATNSTSTHKADNGIHQVDHEPEMRHDWMKDSRRSSVAASCSSSGASCDEPNEQSETIVNAVDSRDSNMRVVRHAQQACREACETSNVSKPSSLSRTSKGMLIDSSTYVDEHISRVIISEETKASSDQADKGTLGPYREALVNSDIVKLRKFCELRGLQHHGQDRSGIIDMLLTDFSFLNKHR